MILYDAKQFYILYRIAEAQEGEFITSNDLSEELNLTSRTIKTFIAEMDEYCQKNGFEIVSKKGNGYAVEVIDDNIYLLYSPKRNICFA